MGNPLAGESKGISFLYEFSFGNRILDNFGSNVIRVSSQADGDFDKANITSEATRHVWRSATVLTEQEIVIKAEIKGSIDTMCILGHNLTDSAIVTLECNIDDNWIAPPFSQILPVDPSSPNIIYASDGTGGDYEYYRITILDPANPCGYIECGRIAGGNAFTFQYDEDITDAYRIGYKDMSESMNTQGYFRASNVNVVVRTININFSKLYTITGRDDNFVNFRALRDYVQTVMPFLVILDRDNVRTLNLWGQFDSLPGESFTVNQFSSFSASITEMF